MKKSLVIVESPAKSRTLAQFLGNNYDVVSSMGHLIDLPSSSMGVDVKNNFAPKYIVIPARKKILQELKKKAKEASIIYLATDPDREGEAISWHLWNELSGDEREGFRVEFHEITKDAIEAAFKNPRKIDMDKVNAQQARRILDRVVGYNLSPLLWEKVGRGLSAGRVQSVALWFIVKREKEINAFKPKEYWELEAELQKRSGKKEKFKAKLFKIDAKKPDITTEKDASQLKGVLESSEYSVLDINEQKKTKTPPAPYTTSKLQQDAFNRLRFSASKTMKIAQELYEGLDIGAEGSTGLITYMRTDSTVVSHEAQKEAAAYVEKNFGKEYLPKSIRIFKSGKLAQLAHEAIRPTSAKRAPQLMRGFLSNDQFKLYDLIWTRFMQSQMASCLVKINTVDISAIPKEKTEGKGQEFIFRATGTEIIFDGFTKLDTKKDDEEKEDSAIPPLEKNEALNLLRLLTSQHFTKPPARYSDASLVKELEEQGIGRPSTYAPTIATIVARHYVERKSGYFYPSEVGMVVTDLLEKHFPDVLDIEFTAEMEEELDKVEEGRMAWTSVLAEFYHRFEKDLRSAQNEMEDVKKRLIETDYKCELCSKPMLFRWSRKGTFLGCSAFPKCKNTKPAKRTPDGRIEIVEVVNPNRTCDKCQKPMIVKYSSRGRFLSCSTYPQCKNAKPYPTLVKCPKPECGGEIVERYSKRGLFYGCSNYPACKYTSRNLPDPQKKNTEAADTEVREQG